MATIRLPPDFKEFLRSLSSHGVEYLVIGGYAVVYHGFTRATGDLDVWVGTDPRNAERLVAALREFGFSVPELSADLFRQAGSVVRMGVPPLRVEIMTTIAGLAFDECYPERTRDVIDDVEIHLISLSHLKANKRAVGRLKDLNDLENLP